MNYDYDIICIGAGSGGLNIAGFMNRAGFKTLLIDKKDEAIGGDCLNHGCVPSKALIHVAKLAAASKSAAKFGLQTSGKVDLQKVVEYVSSKKEYIREHENATHFRKIGMDVELGMASFVGKHTVKVGEKTFTGKKIIIATGSRPRPLDIPGADSINYYTNEQIFSLNTLPDKMVVVGGGPIGMEIAQAFQRLGSQVTVLIRRDTFLPKENKDISAVLLRQLEKEGVQVLFNTEPHSVEEGKLHVVSEGVKKTLEYDTLFVAIGRILNVEGLELEKAGIETMGGKIICDDYLRTSNKNVLLCGDIVGGYQFTHAAELHASVIITNFFSPFKKKIDNSKLSWVTFTDPEIATFGLNAVQLQAKKVPYEKLEVDFSEDDRAIVDDVGEGKLIAYVHKGKLLGGSMVAPNAGELFQELTLAYSAGLDIKQFFSKIYPYPTASRINKRLVGNYFSKKLTDKTKKILKLLYR